MKACAVEKKQKGFCGGKGAKGSVQCAVGREQKGGSAVGREQKGGCGGKKQRGERCGGQRAKGGEEGAAVGREQRGEGGRRWEERKG